MTQSMWLVRHGERIDHIEPSWVHTAERPHDPPLTKTGQLQARRSGDQLGHSRIHRVITSPAIRCVETAVIIADVLNADVWIEPGLREFAAQGTFLVEPAWLPVDVLAKQFEFIDVSYRPATGIENLFPESMPDVLKRCQAVIKHITTHYPKDNVLLVGHAFMHHCIYQAVTNSPPPAVNVPFCAITRFSKNESDRAAVCAGINMTRMASWKCDIFCDGSHTANLD